MRIFKILNLGTAEYVNVSWRDSYVDLVFMDEEAAKKHIKMMCNIFRDFIPEYFEILPYEMTEEEFKKVYDIKYER
jgi:hypothetical protein